MGNQFAYFWGGFCVDLPPRATSHRNSSIDCCHVLCAAITFKNIYNHGKLLDLLSQAPIPLGLRFSGLTSQKNINQ